MNFWRKTVSPVVPPAPPTPTALPVQRANSSRLWVHLLLFFCTIASTATAGAMQQGVDPLTSLAALVHLVEGLPSCRDSALYSHGPRIRPLLCCAPLGSQGLAALLSPPALCFLPRHVGRSHQNSLPHPQQARAPRHWCRGSFSGLCRRPSSLLRWAFPLDRGFSRLLSRFPHRIGGTLALFPASPRSSCPPLGLTKWSS